MYVCVVTGDGSFAEGLEVKCSCVSDLAITFITLCRWLQMPDPDTSFIIFPINLQLGFLRQVPSTCTADGNLFLVRVEREKVLQKPVAFLNALPPPFWPWHLMHVDATWFTWCVWCHDPYFIRVCSQKGLAFWALVHVSLLSLTLTSSTLRTKPDLQLGVHCSNLHIAPLACQTRSNL